MSRRSRQIQKRTYHPPQYQQADTTQVQQFVRQIIHQEFSGPLPPPQVLSQYNEIIPNGAERIMAMAEQQGKHRQELEKIVMNTDARNSLLGIISAFIIGISVLGFGTFVIYIGQVLPGAFLGSGGLFGLVYVFIYGTKQRREERETKAKSN